VLLGNTSASNGWKYVQASNTSSPFSFTIDLTLLTSAVVPGSVIQYFVVAQDNAATANVSVNGATLTSCVTSVALIAGNFPASNITNSFTIPPFPQGAAITPASAVICQGGIQSLVASVTNASPSPSVTWSPVTNLYTDAGATTPYVALANSATVYTNTSASVSYVATITVGTCSTTVTVPITTGPNNWTGNVSSDWNVAGNWCSNSVPTALTNVVIPNVARMPVIGISGANALCNTLTIQTGASLTMQAGYTLTLSAGTTFSNSGTFTSGNTTETVIFAGTGTVSGTSTTSFNNVTINGGVDFGTGLSTVTGNLTLNSGSFVNTDPPTYGPSSTLIYNTNGTYTANTEWKSNATSGAGVPQNVTIGGSSPTQLNFAASAQYRQANGNILINSGSTLTLSTASGGDIKVGGNWTDAGSFTNNSRAVTFNGSGASQTITDAAGETFGYLILNPASITSITLGTATSVTVNGGNGGNSLQLQNGTLDLATGKLTFTNYFNSNLNGIGIDGSAGNLTRNIISTGGTGTLAFTHAAASSQTSAISRLSANASLLVFSSNVLITIACTNASGAAGVNFGPTYSTVNGTLQMNLRSFVTGNAPTYGVGSLLQYNSGSVPYNRTTEWGTASGPGYPYHVEISNNTTLSPGGSGNTGIILNTAGNLTIDAGSSFYLDYGGLNMTVPLTVAGNIFINGNLAESQDATLTGNIILAQNWINNGTFFLNGHTVIFNGTVAQSIGGSNPTTFYNLTNSNTKFAVTMNNGVTVNNTATLNTGAIITINGNAITLKGTVAGLGTFTGDNAATMNILGSVSTTVGTLYYTAGAQLLNTFKIDRWNATTIGDAADLGTSLTVNNLTLNHGVVTTNTNLLTLNNYSGLTAPGGVPWGTNQASFAYSYIATCDATGVPVSVSGNTIPLTGAYGFQINNIGSGGTTGEVYFPVGASYLPVGSSTTIPTPNRMSMDNSTGPADNFNVVVNYGDIDNTPQGRVNRIWYVHSANSTSSNAPDRVTMKLFFVERDNSSGNFPAVENEVEGQPDVAFSYASPIILVEKDYDSNNPNFIAYSQLGDMQSFPFGTYSGKEVYALYTVGISPDVAGNKNGIYQFNRFSITNPGGIILPVKVVYFTAYQKGSGVQTNWTSLNEININHYEVQRSSNAADFNTIGSVQALDNGQTSINYNFTDANPVTGNNYYRIKIFGNDGTITYTNIDVVNIGGGPGSINIYPNPVTNHLFTVQFTNIPAGKYTMEVYNTLGQKIITQSLEHFGGSASQTILLPSGTAKGEYYVQLLGTNLKVNKTLTVQ